MGRREDIETYIWQDEDFDALSGWAALLYIWSFTNDHCNMAGLYRVKRHTMLESKVPANKLEAALGELIAANYVRFERGVMWVRSRVKHLRSKHPNYAVSIAKSVAVLPVDHPLRAAFLAEYAHYGWLASELTPLKSDTVSTVYEDRKDTVARVSPNPVTDENSLHPNDTVSTPSERCMGNGKGKGISSTTTILEKERDGESEGKGEENQPVPDFPDGLADALDATLAVLQRIHQRKGGRAPTRQAVSRVIATYPRRGHEQEARALESWMIDGKGSRQQGGVIVDRYRNWLQNADDAPANKPGLFGKTTAVDPRIAELEAWAAQDSHEVIDSTAEEMAA